MALADARQESVEGTSGQGRASVAHARGYRVDAQQAHGPVRLLGSGMALLPTLTFVLALGYALLASLLSLALLGGRRERRRAAPRVWPPVDLVLPAHNEASTLPAALASLLAQDYPGDVTLWVVDDRSDDGTADVVRAVAEHDPRVRLVSVRTPSRRMAPKVHAVACGIAAGSAPWIVTTDADCCHRRGWLRTLLASADVGDVMVAGYVETARPGRARGLLGHVEAVDWASLMLTNRALLRLGARVASSANNQAYRRSAFEAAGRFGVAGRAPSGDEDLLTQRLGTLPGASVAFADAPEARVLTGTTGSWLGFVRQRRRWVSRYQHPQHYHPGFLAGIAWLGLHSLSLALATLTAPWWPAGHGWLLASWAVVLPIVLTGMHLGLARLGRRDLMGWPVLAWALLHPFVIALAAVWAGLRPGSWRAGAEAYRLRLWRAWWRRAWRRRVSGSAS